MNEDVRDLLFGLASLDHFGQELSEISYHINPIGFGRLLFSLESIAECAQNYVGKPDEPIWILSDQVSLDALPITYDLLVENEGPLVDVLGREDFDMMADSAKELVDIAYQLDDELEQYLLEE